VVVDLAAGTGKLTRDLTRRFDEVIAIEPPAAMREQLARAAPAARALEGTAEGIPLDDASADAVLVAQAFHWFDSRRALDEIARVLRHPLWRASRRLYGSTGGIASARATEGTNHHGSRTADEDCGGHREEPFTPGDIRGLHEVTVWCLTRAPCAWRPDGGSHVGTTGPVFKHSVGAPVGPLGVRSDPRGGDAQNEDADREQPRQPTEDAHHSPFRGNRISMVGRPVPCASDGTQERGPCFPRRTAGTFPPQRSGLPAIQSVSVAVLPWNRRAPTRSAPTSALPATWIFRRPLASEKPSPSRLGKRDPTRGFSASSHDPRSTSVTSVGRCLPASSSATRGMVESASVTPGHPSCSSAATCSPRYSTTRAPSAAPGCSQSGSRTSPANCSTAMLDASARDLPWKRVRDAVRCALASSLRRNAMRESSARFASR
jgi:SAM-dependent methyltransferase